jgi:hypothetical protein
MSPARTRLAFVEAERNLALQYDADRDDAAHFVPRVRLQRGPDTGSISAPCMQAMVLTEPCAACMQPAA